MCASQNTLRAGMIPTLCVDGKDMGAYARDKDLLCLKHHATQTKIYAYVRESKYVVRWDDFNIVCWWKIYGSIRARQ